MGFVFKTRPAHKRTKVAGATVSKTERAFLPDRVDKVGFKVLGQRITVWEGAPRCGKCDRKLVDDRCPKATGNRKWCK